MSNSFVKSITPHLARLITSEKLQDLKRDKAEKQRLKKHSKHKVVVYLRLSDPFSYLLLQVLPELQDRFDLEFDFRTVLNLQSEMYPAPKLWGKNARQDSNYLAKLYQLDAGSLNTDGRCNDETSDLELQQLTAQLLHWELQDGYLENATALFTAYWNQDTDTLNSLTDERVSSHHECYQHHLRANEDLLKQNGHYLSGMLHYGGEWYWGLDRLEHLEQRLNVLDEIPPSTATVKYKLGHSNFCGSSAEAVKQKNAIVIYWSARSPYSYLGLIRAQQLADHYQLPLDVKPVLPMVMRRMQVPKTKGSYITQDTKREAKKYGIDFGFIADPLGSGVERCYSLFDMAKTIGKEVDFLNSFAKGVWSEGIRSDTDDGMKIIVERAGLNWADAQPLLGTQSWRSWAQENLADMYSHDLWGVPSFKYGEHAFFGQDRINCIEQEILKNPDNE